MSNISKPDAIDRHYWCAQHGSIGDEMLAEAAQSVYGLYVQSRQVAGLVHDDGELAWLSAEVVRSVDALAHRFDAWIARGRKGGL